MRDKFQVSLEWYCTYPLLARRSGGAGHCQGRPEDGSGQSKLAESLEPCARYLRIAKDVLKAAFEQFDSSKPLHIVNEKFGVWDPNWLAEMFRERTGQKTRFVKPADLKLLPVEDSDQTMGVFCATEDGAGLERVYQVDFELEQEEYADIDFEILCLLAPNCVNDLRTVLLVNDQRLLGLVYEDLADLVSRGTLSRHQADLLRDGLAPSFLPSSSTFSKVIEESRADPHAKDEWVLKYGRGGIGQGHVFGRVVDGQEWLEKLAAARATNSNPDDGSFVLQKYIHQTEYDLWNHVKLTTVRCHVVLFWFAYNGEFAGCVVARPAKLTALLFKSGDGFLIPVVTDI